MIYNIIAICRNENCTANGFENRFDGEDVDNMKIVCGQCTTIITDVTATEA